MIISNQPLHIIVLAAGEGKRMGNGVTKMLQKVGNQSMLSKVIATARQLKPAKIHVVVGADAAKVKADASGPKVVFHTQKVRKGTADAVLQACKALPKQGVALVVHGDVPLLTVAALRPLINYAKAGVYANLTMRPDNPYGYGRVVRDNKGRVIEIVVQKDATARQRQITECDAGPIAVPIDWLRNNLSKAKYGKGEKERLLPSLVAIASAAGLPVKVHQVDSRLAAGINTPAQLSKANSYLSELLVEQLQAKGVEFADPASVLIRGELSTAPGVFIDRNVIFSGNVSLAAGVQIGANCMLENVQVDANSKIEPFCHIADSQIGINCKVGPFARLRGGVKLAARVKIGNFVEVKQTIVGTGSAAKHLSYLGDGVIGNKVNIGAGTVLANYDGKRKHQTKIGDRAFVGSGSMLIAPVSIGTDATVAAGSVITKSVASGGTAFGRSRQINKPKRK